MYGRAKAVKAASQTIQKTEAAALGSGVQAVITMAYYYSKGILLRIQLCAGE